MHPKGLLTGRMAVEKLFRNVGLSGSREKRWQPILMRADVIQHGTCFDLSRPTYERGHPPAAFPVGILLTTIGGDAGVWPAVVVRAIICRIHDDGVVCDP